MLRSAVAGDRLVDWIGDVRTDQGDAIDGRGGHGDPSAREGLRAMASHYGVADPQLPLPRTLVAW